MGDQRREGLTSAYRAAFAGWEDLIGGLDDDAWSRATGCPGWDVADQLAHVVDVERVMLGDRQRRAQLTQDPAHVRHEFGRFVEMGVEARRGTPPTELVAEAHDTFARRLDHLAALPDDYLDAEQDGPGQGMRMRGAQLLRTRIYDVATHEWDVRRAVGHTATPQDTAHLAISSELILRAWSRVLPATIDRSGVLSVVVDGAELARVDVGEGVLHRGDDGPTADATLGVTAPQLLALAGGRSDAPTLDATEHDGDPELVRAVLGSAAVTP